MKSFHSKMMLCDVIAEREVPTRVGRWSTYENHGPFRTALGILRTLSSLKIEPWYLQETLWPGANVAERGAEEVQHLVVQRRADIEEFRAIRTRWITC